MARLRTSGGDLEFIDEGTGPVVLLLHGFPTSSFLWRHFVPVLASRMRVVAPDLLGYGRSEKPKDADLSVRAQAGYVQELLEHLSVGRGAVIGHDLGGAVAQLLALEGAVDAMVLVDPAAFDVWPIEGVRMLQEAEAGQETPEFVQEVLRLTFDLGMSHKERMSDEMIAAYREPFDGVDGTRAFFSAVRSIDGKGLAGRDEELARLDIPSLILWGEDDPFFPFEIGERLNELLPGSTLALLPGCSHFLPEEAPETIVPIAYEYLRSRYLQEEHGHAPTGPVPIKLERR
jgi:2-hydroxymuconate-semialdehyde hydrolase